MLTFRTGLEILGAIACLLAGGAIFKNNPLKGTKTLAELDALYQKEKAAIQAKFK